MDSSTIKSAAAAKEPPLTGINVVSLEHAIAAPLCTRQLAELGARVIKIERPQHGDFARHYDDRVKGQSSHFIWTNRSKQSLTLNLKHPTGQQILEQLLIDADVLVQNLAPGAASRLGVGYKQLASKHPRLIVCNISGYGDAGPYQDKKAYDLLVQAEGGFLSVTGTDQQPAKSGISIADIAAGMQAKSAILAALLQRARSNEGSEISISMLEAMVEWMGFPLNYAYEGAEPPQRSGADHASIFPYGAFTSADGRTLMLGLQNNREWEMFCRFVLEQPNLIADSRFATNSVRSENREALREIIQSLFSLLSFDQLCSKLDGAKIAYANVNQMADVWGHPQLMALDRQIEFDSPAGKLFGFKPPGNNSAFDHQIGPVPALGQHNHQILTELGYDDEKISQMERDGVI